MPESTGQVKKTSNEKEREEQEFPPFINIQSTRMIENNENSAMSLSLDEKHFKKDLNDDQPNENDEPIIDEIEEGEMMAIKDTEIDEDIAMDS